jgi:hypothetical protein
LARHGGKQGGRPPGRKNNATLDKEAAREALREIVKEHMAEMTAAQVAHAKGIKYLVTRDKAGGKFVKVTEAMAGALKGDEVIEVWEKEPSTQAFTDLMNRTIDKPAEQEQTLNHTGVLEIRWKGGE